MAAQDSGKKRRRALDLPRQFGYIAASFPNTSATEP
jgi:hypothetical protein